MSQTTCRWGILGAAFIARKNWQGIRDAGNATLVAVASRDLGRARAFIRECQDSAPHPLEPEAMDDYQALLNRPDIDAVYLPLPTTLRKQWVLRAAAAGKHVLVEKPVGRTAADVEEILTACEKHGVQFMDGVMFMHSQRLEHLRGVIDHEVGPIRHISSQFSFKSDDEFEHSNIRAQGQLEPLGCLGDLGWYCLRFSLWAMSEAAPESVSARILRETKPADNTPGVPLEFSGTLYFADGASASFYCSFTTAHAQWAIVSGAKALLQVSDFVLPFSGPVTEYSLSRAEFAVSGCRSDMTENRVVTAIGEPSSNAPDSQESQMFSNFSSLVLSGRREDRWPKSTLLTQRVLDACLLSARRNAAPVFLA